MILLEDLYRACSRFRPLPDPSQRQAIDASLEEPLFVVAGPGTGKTTCLTLRILKLILVDGIPPHGVLATTFTNKAAAELRSRVLGWGFRLIEELQHDIPLGDDLRQEIDRIDINQVVTGTIDSICEEVLRDFREPGTQPPILADDYVAKTLMLRNGLFESARYQDPDLDAFLRSLHGASDYGYHIGRKNDLLQGIWERRFQDQVDWTAFLESRDDRERTILAQALDGYHNSLNERLMIDFALLEQDVLDRLRNRGLTEFTDQIRVLLVDEYQDSNALQEAVYFELASACGGALTVVGDDDQSLYRFRGATVELFTDFPARYENHFGTAPRPIFLRTNYRSTSTIVDLANDYARLDPGYQAVRVDDKPRLNAGSGAEVGMRILGMFRDDVETLATDLSDFIYEVFRGQGYHLPSGEVIRADPNGGDLGDCALLCSSPQEYSSSRKPRLPLLLRSELATKGVGLFNPRGQDLQTLPLVAVFGGLLLECLDPGGAVEGQTNGLTQSLIATFADWRTAAIQFVDSDAVPSGLRDYAVGWAERNPRCSGCSWPRTVPVLELVYGLTHFFPELYDDPEGQVYLEVFTRQLCACEQVSRYEGRVIADDHNPQWARASVSDLLRDFLAPIASGTVKVNEDLMETFPRDRLSILSIHQSKGLEFPLTIVDVGADFSRNQPAQRFRRFPDVGGTPHVMEDLIRQFSSLPQTSRSARDRAFDDLYRQFFVAYSRAQEVLLLVGLTKIAPGGQIPNVATGWRRDGTNVWAGQSPLIQI